MRQFVPSASTGTNNKPHSAGPRRSHQIGRRKRRKRARLDRPLFLSARSQAAIVRALSAAVLACPRRACLRASRASREKPPCFHLARRLRASPSAVRGPALIPPCIRQRRLPRIADARHGLPARVIAPHRGACIGSPGGFPFFNQPPEIRDAERLTFLNISARGAWGSSVRREACLETAGCARLDVPDRRAYSFLLQSPSTKNERGPP